MQNLAKNIVFVFCAFLILAVNNISFAGQVSLIAGEEIKIGASSVSCESPSEGANCEYFYQDQTVHCGHKCEYFHQDQKVHCTKFPTDKCEYFYQDQKVRCGHNCKYFHQDQKVHCAREGESEG